MERQSRIVLRERSTPRTYWLTRFMILRLLGIVYAVGFLVAINQILPLIGSHGLLPLDTYFTLIGNALGYGSGFVRLPSVFWLWRSDTALITAVSSTHLRAHE